MSRKLSKRKFRFSKFSYEFINELGYNLNKTDYAISPLDSFDKRKSLKSAMKDILTSSEFDDLINLIDDEFND